MAGDLGRKRHAPGKGTDWTGLPVFSLTGPGELRGEFLRNLRSRLEARGLDLAVPGAGWTPFALSLLSRLHDLVVVEGPCDLPLRRIHLGGPGKGPAGELVCPDPGGEPVAEFTVRLVARLDELVNRTPVWASILIGGRSSRMGRPKHLIAGDGGQTWLERTIGILQPLVDGLVVSGEGQLPGPVAETVRLSDIPGVSGPLSGIISAFRWQPQVSWLVVACDMPGITTEAVQWLLGQRRAGCWGKLPKLAGSTRGEPLFAWYDCRAGQLFEEQLLTGNLRISGVASHPRIDNPTVPEPLRPAFMNVNTPEELGAVAQP